MASRADEVIYVRRNSRSGGHFVLKENGVRAFNLGCFSLLLSLVLDPKFGSQTYSDLDFEGTWL